MKIICSGRHSAFPAAQPTAIGVRDTFGENHTSSGCAKAQGGETADAIPRADPKQVHAKNLVTLACVCACVCALARALVPPQDLPSFPPSSVSEIQSYNVCNITIHLPQHRTAKALCLPPSCSYSRRSLASGFVRFLPELTSRPKPPCPNLSGQHRTFDYHSQLTTNSILSHRRIALFHRPGNISLEPRVEFAKATL